VPFTVSSSCGPLDDGDGAIGDESFESAETIDVCTEVFSVLDLLEIVMKAGAWRPISNNFK
jgi:hypothetical protein